MGYYNFIYIFKNVVYNFMKIFKYLSISLVCISFIVICLLLISTYSSANTIGVIPQSVYDKAVELQFNSTNVCIMKNVNDGNFYIFHSETNTGAYWNYWTFRNINGNYLFIGPDYQYYDITVFNVNTRTFNLIRSHIGSLNLSIDYPDLIFVYTGNNVISRDDWTTIFYDKSNNYTIVSDREFFGVPPALYPNASQVQSEQDALTSGNFTFFIVDPGTISENSNILLNFYDVTNFDDNTIAQSITLNKDSPFFEYTNIQETEYHYVITARFLNWFEIVNGKRYKAILSWINPNDSTDMQSVTYTWTMSLTAEQQQIVQDTTQQQINSGIQDLNNFITDDTVSPDATNDFVNSMPNSSTFTNPADSGIDNIFTAFENAFTSNNGQTLRFYIPFTNGQYIDIPPDIVSSHLPNIIKNLIQMFYWFLICRYIVKDISNTANKAKSGELLDNKDGNIKTELL